MIIDNRTLELVRERTGLAFSASRAADAEAGVARVMASLQIDDAADFHERVRDDPSAFDVLTSELAVGETYFFRDRDQFALIRERVLPEACRRRGSAGVVRIWSAGCSSGEEAYSLAIACVEDGVRSTILGTDLSLRALEKAEAAVYSAWSLRGTQPWFRERYFTPVAERVALNDEIRRRVRFERLNLASESYPSRVGGTFDLDLILCRNVLIYFDARTAREVGKRLMRCLAPGGWLFLGASDPALDCIEGVRRESTGYGVAYQRVTACPEPVVDEPVIPIVAAPFEVAPVPIEHDVPVEPELDVVRAVNELRAAADTRRSADLLDLAREMVERFPVSAELHFLEALLLIDVGSDREAEAALRRALFLDNTLAAAHFALGSLLHRRGETAEAMRALRNAIAVSARDVRGDGIVLGEGTSGEEIRAAAELALRVMEGRNVE